MKSPIGRTPLKILIERFGSLKVEYVNTDDGEVHGGYEATNIDYSHPGGMPYFSIVSEIDDGALPVPLINQHGYWRIA